MSDATYAAVEDALRAHIPDETEGNLLTDWVVLTASVGAHSLETLYVDMCSETAGHSIEGLLQRGVRRIIDRQDSDDDPDELDCD